MSPTDPILDAAAEPPAEVPLGNHPAPPAVPIVRQSRADRLFDRALTMAVQLGAAKAQIAILTQSLRAAQAKAAEPGAARCSAATLRELFEYIKTQPIQAIKMIRALTGCELKEAKDILESGRGPLGVL